MKEFGFAALSTTELNNTKANIVSVYQAGAFFGALFAFVVGHYLGRRWGLVLFSAVFTLGAGVMLDAHGATTGLAPIYAGRVLAGFGIGTLMLLVPSLRGSSSTDGPSRRHIQSSANLHCRDHSPRHQREDGRPV